MDDNPINIHANKIGVIGEDVKIDKQVVIYNYTTVFYDTKETTGTGYSNLINANPYKGLTHFGSSDAKLFFGRKTLINSDDGSQIVTTSHDNTARIYKIMPPEKLVAYFNGLHLPPLTDEERQTYFLD